MLCRSVNTRLKYAQRTEPLVISVPPGDGLQWSTCLWEELSCPSCPSGTEVRKKKGNWLLGELLQPRDSLVVARGGSGGLGVVAPSREQKIRKAAQAASFAVGESMLYCEDGTSRPADGMMGRTGATYWGAGQKQTSPPAMTSRNRNG